jgi:prefoldin subunit 5
VLDRPLFFEPARTVQHPQEKRTAKQTVKSGASQAESDSLVPIGQTLMTSALFFKIGQ